GIFRCDHRIIGWQTPALAIVLGRQAVKTEMALQRLEAAAILQADHVIGLNRFVDWDGGLGARRRRPFLSFTCLTYARPCGDGSSDCTNHILHVGWFNFVICYISDKHLGRKSREIGAILHSNSSSSCVTGTISRNIEAAYTSR